MAEFEPSRDFVTRIMKDVRAYETEMTKHRERIPSFVLSRPVFSIVSAGGILLGICNLIRMALILISPVPCL